MQSQFVFTHSVLAYSILRYFRFPYTCVFSRPIVSTFVKRRHPAAEWTALNEMNRLKVKRIRVFLLNENKGFNFRVSSPLLVSRL